MCDLDGGCVLYRYVIRCAVQGIDPAAASLEPLSRNLISSFAHVKHDWLDYSVLYSQSFTVKDTAG